MLEKEHKSKIFVLNVLLEALKKTMFDLEKENIQGWQAGKTEKELKHRGYGKDQLKGAKKKRYAKRNLERV